MLASVGLKPSAPGKSLDARNALLDLKKKILKPPLLLIPMFMVILSGMGHPYRTILFRSLVSRYV